MAIPTALAKQKSKLQAQADAVATTTVVDLPVLPAATVSTTDIIPLPVRVTDKDETDLSKYSEQLDTLNSKLQSAITPEAIAEVQQEITALRQKYSSMLGRLQAEAKRADSAEARAQLQSDEVKVLEARATEAERQRDELNERERSRERREKLAGLDDTTDDLGEEELQSFDPKDLRMVRGLTKKQFTPVIKELMSEVDALREQVKQLQPVGQQVNDMAKTHQVMAAEAARAAEHTYYMQQLTPHVPEWEKLVKTSEWKTFLALPSGDKPGVLKGHMLAHYRGDKYLPGIVAVFNEFQMRNANKSGSIEALVIPSKSSADRPTPQKITMRTSEYEKEMHKYTRAKSITKEEWEKYKSEFTKARLEGRVVDDANLLPK